ncbi:MAG: lysoplasmalogenase [Pseudomonadota bacterium]
MRRSAVRLGVPDLALLVLSIGLAITYGWVSSQFYAVGTPHWWDLPALKASSVVLLALLALLRGPRLLATGLAAGAVGDFLLALGGNGFMAGAMVFLLGHLAYFALFVRSGGVADRMLPQQFRIVALVLIYGSAIVMTPLLVPGNTPLFLPLAIYTAVLAAMTAASFRLPMEYWLTMTGAVLFFISDGFVAADMFHRVADPALAFWRGFAGWMIYWAGQAGICVGSLSLLTART